MPEHFHPLELKRFLELAAQDRRTLEETRYAYRAVRGWWLACQEKRGDWVMVVINAMRAGWAMRGYRLWQSKDPNKKLPVNARTGEVLHPRTKLTKANIPSLVVAYAAKHGIELPQELTTPTQQGELFHVQATRRPGPADG